jgi:hypothetical protein
MKLAKLLLHSLPGGALFALLIALLLFYLNPEAPLGAVSLWETWLPLAASYGLAAVLAWPLGLAMIRFFARRKMRLRWASFALFHRFYLANATLAAAVWWANFATTPVLLAPADRRLLLAGCGLLTLGCALGGVLSLQHVISRTPAVRWGQGIVVAVLFAALVALRLGTAGEMAPAPTPEMEVRRTGRRVVLVAVDGLSLDLILPLAADGKAPSFRFLMRQGAWGRVDSFVPTTPPVIWTTVATGVLPYRHGILDYVRFETSGGGASLALAPRYLLFRRLEHMGLASARPVESGDRLVPAFWSILGHFGMDVQVLDWWATFPPEPVQGVILPQPPGGWEAPGIVAADPLAEAPELVRDVEERLARMADWGGMPDPGIEVLEATVRRALALDMRALAEARRVDAAAPPAVLALYLPGLDLVQHRFLGYAMEAPHSEGTDRAGVLFGEVVARYYRFLDEELGSLLAGDSGSPRMLLVVSGFGVERLPPWSLRRLWAGQVAREGYHDRAPAGAYFALGGGIQGEGDERAAIQPADILPTFLYYLGLPVGRDMHGRPRVDWFSDTFIGSQPLAYVPSYRGLHPPPSP